MTTEKTHPSTPQEALDHLLNCGATSAASAFVGGAELKLSGGRTFKWGRPGFTTTPAPTAQKAAVAPTPAALPTVSPTPAPTAAKTSTPAPKEKAMPTPPTSKPTTRDEMRARNVELDARTRKAESSLMDEIGKASGFTPPPLPEDRFSGKPFEKFSHDDTAATRSLIEDCKPSGLELRLLMAEVSK